MGGRLGGASGPGDPRETAPVTHVCFLVTMSAGLLAQRHPASNYFKTFKKRLTIRLFQLLQGLGLTTLHAGCSLALGPQPGGKSHLRASHVLSEGPEGCMEHCCVRHIHIGRDPPPFRLYGFSCAHLLLVHALGYLVITVSLSHYWL